MRVAWLLTFAVLSWMPATARAGEFAAEAYARGIVAKLNALLGTGIEFTIEHSDRMSKAAPSGGFGEVTFADLDLAGFSKRPYGERTEEALAFLVAHEFSHNLIDIGGDPGPLPDWFERVREEGFLDGPFAELTRDLLHENVDGFAAKLLRHLGIPIEGGLAAFADSVDRYEQFERAAPYRALMAERSIWIRAAYDEGWSDWKAYRPVLSPCAGDSGAVFRFLAGIGAARLTGRIGSASCRFFGESQVLRAIRLGHERYAKVYLAK